MEYASGHLNHTAAHSIFPRAAPSPFHHLPPPHLYLCSPPSFLPARSPRRAATLPRSVSAGVLVSDGVLVDPASGPVVFQCHTSQAEH